MDKKILLLLVLLIADMAFAKGTPYDPYLDGKAFSAYCRHEEIFLNMRDAVKYDYNVSYYTEMNAIANSFPASQGMLYEYYCNSPYDVASFNAEYSNTFNQLMARGTAIYFRSAFDAVRSGSTTWTQVLSNYNGFQQDMQNCVNYYRINGHFCSSW